MPERAPTPPEAAPADLDTLIARALRTGRTDGLEDAIRGAVGGEAPITEELPLEDIEPLDPAPLELTALEVVPLESGSPDSVEVESLGAVGAPIPLALGALEPLAAAPVDPTDLPDLDGPPPSPLGPAPDPGALLDLDPTALPDPAGLFAERDPTEAPPLPAVAPPEATPEELLAALEQAAGEARIRLARGEDALPALDQAADALEKARVALRRQPVPDALPAAMVTPVSMPREQPSLRLPSFRKEWALAIDGAGDPNLAPVLAEALGVDLATARMLAASRHTRIAARDDVPALLRLMAAALTVSSSLRSTVIARDQVLEIAAPLTLLQLPPSGPCRVTDELGAWLRDPDQLADLTQASLELEPPRLAVLGEVVVHRFRQQSGSTSRFARKREASLSSLSERRVGVVDLHAPGRFVRLVEGLSRLGEPDNASSSRLALRTFIDQLPTRWPGVVVEERRVCRPPEAPAPELEAGEVGQTSGWAVFEQHTRVCRLHRLGPGA